MKDAAGEATVPLGFGVLADDGGESLDYWPQWRGPLGTGVARQPAVSVERGQEHPLEARASG